MSIQQKVQLFKASTLSVLLYGCESRVLTSDLCRKLDSFQTPCLRIILCVSRRDQVRGEKEIDERMGTVPLSRPVKARQIRFLGHCLRRHQEDLISKYALNHPTYGKPRPGGRKGLFNEYAAKLINPEYLPFPYEIRKMAQDRWKRVEDDCWYRWHFPWAPQPSRERKRERIHSLQQFYCTKYFTKFISTQHNLFIFELNPAIRQ